MDGRNELDPKATPAESSRSTDSDGHARPNRRRLLTGIATIGVATSLSGFVTPGEYDRFTPELVSIEVEDSSNPPWMWYYTRWKVSNGIADLATVRSELYHDGTVVATTESSVSGTEASGKHRLRTKGDADTLRVTVIDEWDRRSEWSVDIEELDSVSVDDDTESESDDTSSDADGGDDAEPGVGDDAETDGGEGEATDTDDQVATGDSAEGPGADGTPGPGILATLASISGASYLLVRLRGDDTG